MSWQAPLAQVLDDLFGPLFCLLYADTPSMSRTVLPLSQALQVLLRHIESIYLSHATLNKMNHLEARITHLPL
jgi:hypothetical protein